MKTKHIKLYEQFTNTWHQILIDCIECLKKVGFKSKDGVYTKSGFKYGYKLDRTSINVYVVDEDCVVKDNYEMNDFCDNLKKHGIEFIKNNQKHIEAGHRLENEFEQEN